MDNEYVLRDIINYCSKKTGRKLCLINTQIKKIFMSDVRLRIIARYYHCCDVFEAEMEANDFECFKYSHKYNFPFCDYHKGYPDMHGRGSSDRSTDYELLIAIEKGNLECVKYICEHLYECNYVRSIDACTAMEHAISSDQFECVEYFLQLLQSRDPKYFTDNEKSRLCAAAVKNGSLKYLKYLCEHNVYCKNVYYNFYVIDIIDIAIMENNYDCVKYLVSLGNVSKLWKIPKEQLDYVIQVIKDNAE